MNATITLTLDTLRQHLAAGEPSSFWLHLGDAIAALEAISQKHMDGRTWLEVVNDLYGELGHEPLSLGHLQKIRRVRNFVRTALEQSSLHYSDKDIETAQMSALEIADRLYSLDQPKGREALVACIQDKRSFADMKREYQIFVEQNPLLLPKKQSTWLQKRTTTARESTESAIVEKAIMSDPLCYLGTENAVLRSFEPGHVSHLIRKTDCGFRYRSSKGDQWLGVQFHKDFQLTRRDEISFLAMAEFQSSFFDWYWIFINGTAESAKDLNGLMSSLHIEHIGIASFEGGEWKVLRQPASSPPFEARRNWLTKRYR